MKKKKSYFTIKKKRKAHWRILKTAVDTAAIKRGGGVAKEVARIGLGAFIVEVEAPALPCVDLLNGGKKSP